MGPTNSAWTVTCVCMNNNFVSYPETRASKKKIKRRKTLRLAFSIGSKQSLRAYLDGMKTEWYHSVFMIHHPNQVDPTGEHLFGLVLDHLFHDSNTHKNGWEWENENRFGVFSKLENWNAVAV